MKNSVFFFTFLCIASYVTAQKLNFGIQTGVHYRNIDVSTQNPVAPFETIKGKNGGGFFLGINAGYTLLPRLELSIQSNLLFGEDAFQSTFTDNTPARKDKTEFVMIQIPVDLRFMLFNNQQLYLIGGAEYAYDLSTEEFNSTYQNSIWSIRGGMGVNIPFARFTLSPELIYSSNLSNLKGDFDSAFIQSIHAIDVHQIALSLKFTGPLN